MRRDMALIRTLMLKLEAYPLRENGILIVSSDDPEVAVEGYDRAAITYHLRLMVDAGLIDTGNASSINGIGFRGFSWSGHDFLDSVRDPEIWRKTQGVVEEVGGFSMEMIKALAKGFIKKKVEQHTGVDLDF